MKSFNKPLQEFRTALSTNKDAMKTLSDAARKEFGKKYKFLKEEKPKGDSSDKSKDGASNPGGEPSQYMDIDYGIGGVFADVDIMSFAGFMDEAAPKLQPPFAPMDQSATMLQPPPSAYLEELVAQAKKNPTVM